MLHILFKKNIICELFLEVCAGESRRWQKYSHQKAYRGQADVQFLVLKTKAASYSNNNLEACARHSGKEVCYHQLQALEGCSD